MILHDSNVVVYFWDRVDGGLVIRRVTADIVWLVRRLLLRSHAHQLFLLAFQLFDELGGAEVAYIHEIGRDGLVVAFQLALRVEAATRVVHRWARRAEFGGM